MHRSERGAVVEWDSEAGRGVVFRCPCSERIVNVKEPPHTITFMDDGRLHLDGSCGYAGNDEHPQNWCHFWIRNGEAAMVSDAKCPGADLVP